jgi:hypothetical protein
MDDRSFLFAAVLSACFSIFYDNDKSKAFKSHTTLQLIMIKTVMGKILFRTDNNLGII